MKKFKSVFGGFSLTFRISLGILLLVTTLMGAIGASTYLNDRKVFMDEAVNRGWTTVATVNTFAAAHMRGENYTLLNELVNNLKQDHFIASAVVINNQGTIVAHNDDQLIGQTMNSTALNQVMESKKEQMNAIRSSSGQILGYSFTTPITDATNQVYGYFHLVVDLSFVHAHLQQTVHNFLITFVVAMLFALFLTRLIVLRYVHRPVQELLSATEKVSTGDFSSELPVKTKDEMGRLAQGFNTMNMHLAVLFSSIKTTANEMSHTSSLIAKRSELNGDLDNESIDARRQQELMKEINSSAKRLYRMSDKLNSLALQFKTK